MKHRLYGAILCVGMMALAAAPASAAIIYGPDTFNSTDEGWVGWTGYNSINNVFARQDIGGGDYAMAATVAPGQGKLAVKKVDVTKRMTLDLDFRVGFQSDLNNTNFINVMFHLEKFLTSGATGSRHYEVKWVKGSNPTPGVSLTDNYGLQLWERSARWGTYSMLTETEVLPFDSNAHKMRITDDGTGKINVYFDNMDAPILSYDDSASYTAGTANWVAVEIGQQTTGGLSWFQNVTVHNDVVPEPMTLSLLVLGGLVGVARRRLA